jgi:hypothetical protein
MTEGGWYDDMAREGNGRSAGTLMYAKQPTQIETNLALKEKRKEVV